MLVKDEQDMRIVVDEALQRMNPKGMTRCTLDAHVLALSGDLGTGKTTFTKALAKKIGVTEHITSPTFVIQKLYTIPSAEIISKLVHIDAYRLENEAETKAIDLHTTLHHNPFDIVVIEWAEKIKKILPTGTIWLYFKYIDETTREVTFG